MMGQTIEGHEVGESNVWNLEVTGHETKLNILIAALGPGWQGANHMVAGNPFADHGQVGT